MQDIVLNSQSEIPNPKSEDLTPAMRQYLRGGCVEKMAAGVNELNL